MKIKDIVRILSTPRCWLRNYGTSAALSAFINESLDNNHSIDFLLDRIIKLNGKELWIGNYPYAFGSLYERRELIKFLPDRTTVFRLHDALEKELLK